MKKTIFSLSIVTIFSIGIMGCGEVNNSINKEKQDIDKAYKSVDDKILKELSYAYGDKYIPILKSYDSTKYIVYFNPSMTKASLFDTDNATKLYSNLVVTIDKTSSKLTIKNEDDVDNLTYEIVTFNGTVHLKSENVTIENSNKFDTLDAAVANILHSENDVDDKTSTLTLETNSDKTSFIIRFKSSLSEENYNASYVLKGINPVIINQGINTNAEIITTCQQTKIIRDLVNYRCDIHYELPSELEGYFSDYSQNITLDKETTYGLYLKNYYRNVDTTSSKVALLKL